MDGYEITLVGTDVIQTSSDTASVIRQLTPGSSYSIAVRSYRADRKSLWSSPITVNLPQAKPDAPTITTEGMAGGKIRLAWGPVTGATSYKVRQCDHQTGSWRAHPFTEPGQDAPFTISTSGTTATVSGLTDQITYTFRIGAVNDAGTTWSQPIDGTAGATPPETPQRSPGDELCPSEETGPMDLTVTVSASAVELNWTPSTETDVTNQYVLRRVPKASWTKFPVALDASSYTDSSVQPGNRYIYRIAAYTADEIANNRPGRAVESRHRNHNSAEITADQPHRHPNQHDGPTDLDYPAPTPTIPSRTSSAASPANALITWTKFSVDLDRRLIHRLQRHLRNNLHLPRRGAQSQRQGRND